MGMRKFLKSFLSAYSRNTMYIGNKFFDVLDGILSPEECQFLIDRFEKEELKPLQTSMADYDRGIWDNEEWSDKIFQRVKPFLPAEIRDVAGVNTYLRFSKYKDGGRFDMHIDGVNQDKHGRRTIMTINIFLNSASEFSGGETEFFDDAGQLAFKAVPKAGRGAIFDRTIPHCGNVVRDGYKYLIRTDVMM
jgi:hypothetical protein